VEKKQGGDKWSQLYNLREKKQSRQNRNLDEIEIEKAEGEYTFKPQISKKSL
jgi:hypothetical protein